MSARDVMLAILLESGLQGEYGSLPTQGDADRILSAFRRRGFVVAPVEWPGDLDGARQSLRVTRLQWAQMVSLLAAAQEPDTDERHLTTSEQRVMRRALMRSAKIATPPEDAR